jgi:two-component system, chemotaxis family, chemotaxis protein CheY
MNILIVDDAIFMRTILKNILTQNGYNVIGEASNGNEAYSKYISLKPDLVTMDITMNDLNGIDALKKIKEYDANAKIIMCSAMGQQGMVIDSIKYGAKDFIVKPFNAERVVEAINNTFK